MKKRQTLNQVETKIEDFISENLHRYFLLGFGSSEQSINELRNILRTIEKQTIFELENKINLIDNPKIAVLTAQLVSDYAKNHLGNETLSKNLNAIVDGISKSFRYQSYVC